MMVLHLRRGWITILCMKLTKCLRLTFQKKQCLCITGATDRIREAKDRAISANLTATATLDEIQQFSQQLLTTSGILMRVNKTVRETNELINDSTRTGKFTVKSIKSHF